MQPGLQVASTLQTVLQASNTIVRSQTEKAHGIKNYFEQVHKQSFANYIFVARTAHPSTQMVGDKIKSNS